MPKRSEREPPGSNHAADEEDDRKRHWRDRPVEEEADKDIKQDGMEQRRRGET